MDYIASKIATSMARSHENFFCNGTGSTQPQGVGYLTTDFLSANRVLLTGTTGTAASISGDNIVDTYFAVAPQYRANGSWVMSDAAMKTIRKIKTLASGSNEYIYKLNDTGDLRDGVLGVLLGRPVYVSPFYNTTSGASKCFATFGDFGHGYEIFDRSGMNMLVDPYVDAAKALTNIYAYSRLDSKITTQEAFSVLGNSAS
jgi:HK97 family phage major capsid protein